MMTKFSCQKRTAWRLWTRRLGKSWLSCHPESTSPGFPRRSPPVMMRAMPWISSDEVHHVLEGMQGPQLKSVQNCLANQSHQPAIHLPSIYDHRLATLIWWPENVNEGHMENPWCVWTWISIQVVAFESSNNYRLWQENDRCTSPQSPRWFDHQDLLF